MTRQVRNKKEQEQGILLRSTGGFGKMEHVEDVFDVWQESTVQYLAYEVQ